MVENESMKYLNLLDNKILYALPIFSILKNQIINAKYEGYGTNDVKLIKVILNSKIKFKSPSLNYLYKNIEN
ncbi:hypothetical protein DT74_14705 [Acinetobacter sp. ETR1]|jgi:hypothetical protein|nr:hypothetical protein F981_03758 [Acinetobacter guillouiae CIP 63.46]KEC83564.1 hypothetical protein DT74_14705 [Acinetobacter sp. ETR1]